MDWESSQGQSLNMKNSFLHMLDHSTKCLHEYRESPFFIYGLASRVGMVGREQRSQMSTI